MKNFGVPLLIYIQKILLRIQESSSFYELSTVSGVCSIRKKLNRFLKLIL